ncbi:phage integrase [Marinomonas piezotolerans]|nr:tyrosine-type recombinase/integrase [Marinomonas piezotolerans]
MFFGVSKGLNLKMTIKKDGNSWLVDVYPWGRKGRRIRKKFNSKGEATRFERHILGTASGEQPWNESPPDNRELSELINIWFLMAGQYLKDGERRKVKMLAIADRLGNPIARIMTEREFALMRAKRTAEGISAKTLNNELAYIKAMFNVLKKQKEITFDNPLNDLDPLKIGERELSYLTHEQIDILLDAFKSSENEHVELITLICLSTGARWGEAEGLTRSRVHNNKVTFTDTKSGKNRSIPISDWLFERLIKHSNKTKSPELFTFSLSAFRRALARSGIELPKGQAAHVLRHTFASHFVMNGGNILTLQRILGHSDIRMTMRYSHLAPDHLKDAVFLNPLNDRKIS